MPRGKRLPPRAPTRDPHGQLPQSCNACPIKSQTVYGGICHFDTQDFEGLVKRRFVLPPKRMLMKEGDTAGDAYTIAFGWIARYKMLPNGQRQILAFLLPGDLAGGDFIDDVPITFSLQTLTQVGLCEFPRRELYSLLMRDQKTARGMGRYFMSRMLATEQLLTTLGRRSAPERIASLVLQLYDRLAQRNMIDGGKFDLPLRLTDIADALGLTPVHVSRTLATMRQQQLFSLGNGKAQILDEKRLRTFANLG